MEKSFDKDKSEIREFFEGRSVLITGASGYVGGVLLEHLLRLCPGIVEIFILLREKRGSSPVERRLQVFDKPTFCKVKKDTPEALEKVHVISGELVKDDLGISPEDFEKLENVSIVFHCAACVSFKRDLSYMVRNNVLGTYNVLNLCKKLPKIAALVHTSTAYANCHLEVIKEDIIHIPVPVDKIIQAARSNDEEFINSLKRDHGQNWYNDYVFTKSITESVLAREALDISTTIVRPSIISHVWKGSLPGYIESGTSFADSIYGVVVGILQVLFVDENKKIDTVPCDIVANTLIATAWSTATKRVDSTSVVNCISSNTEIVKFWQLFGAFTSRRFPVFCPNTFRTPSVSFASSPAKYKLLAFFYHHLPAFGIDMLLALTGSKLRLGKLYKTIDENFNFAQYFLLREFSFESENFDNLRSLLNKKDSEIFTIDLTGYNCKYMAEYCSVNEGFRYKENESKLKFRQFEIAERIALLTTLYKCSLVMAAFTIVWFFLQLVFSLLI